MTTRRLVWTRAVVSLSLSCNGETSVLTSFNLDEIYPPVQRIRRQQVCRIGVGKPGRHAPHISRRAVKTGEDAEDGSRGLQVRELNHTIKLGSPLVTLVDHGHCLSVGGGVPSLLGMLPVGFRMHPGFVGVLPLAGGPSPVGVQALSRVRRLRLEVIPLLGMLLLREPHTFCELLGRYKPLVGLLAFADGSLLLLGILHFPDVLVPRGLRLLDWLRLVQRLRLV